MTDSYSEILPEYRDDLEKIGASGADIVFFLHTPKTGGSSVVSSVRRNGLVPAISLPELSKPKAETCRCGATDCGHQQVRTRQLINFAIKPEQTGFPIYLFTGNHTNFANAERIMNSLKATGSLSYLTTVRPARQRIISVFRDYWTQVDTITKLMSQENLQLPDIDGNPSAPHVRAVREGYLEDSKHYIDDNGVINGRAWFSAFGEHGAGVPFYLSEVFNDDPKRFRKLVKSGTLRVVATRDVDSLTKELTGEVRPRKRKSIDRNPAVEQAIIDASDIIDELALRDAEFDRFLARYLHRPEFKPPRRKLSRILAKKR